MTHLKQEIFSLIVYNVFYKTRRTSEIQLDFQIPPNALSAMTLFCD